MLVSTIINYFLEIATRLKEIQHTTENPKYAQVNLSEYMEKLEVNLNTSTPVLLLNYPHSRIQDKLSDNPHEIVTITFLVIQEIEANNFEEEIQILDLTKTICLKILSKIYEDTKNRTFLSGLNRNTIKMSIIRDEPNTNIFGHIVEFEANSNLTEQLYFRENDWLS